jgi:hypothetical protein
MKKKEQEHDDVSRSRSDGEGSGRQDLREKRNEVVSA